MIYICTTRFKNLRYNSVRKLLTVFPVNEFPVFLITKCFMLDVKGFLDHLCMQYIRIVKVVNIKCLDFTIWWKSNTRAVVKTLSALLSAWLLCFPTFLTISYSFPWSLRMFSLESLWFPRVFLQFPLSVSLVS